ncbi:hypothetical protein LQE93_11035 [Clostridium sp. NSJ-145]|uniref:hypothetical protein n=1 Tax=Clostridium sp. NSJ-145 TaxID=2897777 RepID=UPI001E28A05E|nr:hypothetical protein [Clostridium sp. NSJ-145]MCD2502314.1 hypothetical protein [Clostridium sp. NSJ-145]
MILSTIILGVAVIAGTSMLANYWNSMLAWLKRGINKVKEVIGHIVYGTKVFIKKIKEAIKEISRHYSQEEIGRWKETIVTREIPESEVPPEIRAKALQMNQEIDITEELELQLA